MTTTNLDHLGLVAGIIDELGLVELTDEKIPPHKLQHISAGQVLKAMILNCLGFVSAPLYLFSQFFESKPTEHLLGPGIQPHHLNDDRIDCVLDDLYEQDTTTFFLEVATQAADRFNVKADVAHLDSSSISVAGEYEPEPQEEKVKNEESTKKAPIEICRGYSRDHRPDLKQFITNLVCSGDGGVPLWLKVTSGNVNDAQGFADIMSEFSKNWQMDGLFVIDAAFYNQTNLEKAKDLYWLSRVPLTLTAAKKLVQTDTSTLRSVPCQLKGYKMWEVEQEYGGIKQRWILVENQTRKKDTSLWEKEIKRLERRLNREFKELKEQKFACEPDARNSLLKFQKKLEFHQLIGVEIKAIYGKRGRPAQAAAAAGIQGYRIQGQLQRQDTAAQQIQCRKSRFILATNQLDREAWPAEKLLEEYKDQQKVERGFRFLKDPLFFTQSVFVKKAERVEALALVMALTLMVYALAERRLRQELARQQETVFDPLKRPTAKPTFRWILQKFQGVHLAVVRTVKKINNLTAERRKIARLMGPAIEKYYSTA